MSTRRKKRTRREGTCARDKYLRKTYGITLDDYAQLFAEQRESCWICERHQENFKTALAVDHNHKTGRVRGLLCYACNKYKVGRNNLETATKLYHYMIRFETDSKEPQ